MIFLVGSGLALFLCFLLMGKKGKSGADTILALWMLFTAMDLFFFYYDRSEVIFEFFLLVHGPFLLIYIRFLTGDLPRKRSLLMLHFIPAVAAYAYFLPLYILPSHNAEFFLAHQAENDTETYYIVTYILVLISGMCYLTRSIMLLWQYRQGIKDQFSYIEKMKLNWLKFLILGITVIWGIVLIPFDDMSLVQNNLDFLEDDIFDHLIGFLVVVFIFLIGYFGIRQTTIFVSSGSSEEPGSNSKRVRTRYARSNLTGEVADKLQEKLLREVKERKLFLKNDITLGELAVQLEANTTYLSQVINERCHSNFCDFINMYRVEEFKSRVSDIITKKESILSLAFECGFNSKSSFNAIFKRQTGCTPRDFVRQQENFHE
jgi:AraC-like DNA-binding protein